MAGKILLWVGPFSHQNLDIFLSFAVQDWATLNAKLPYEKTPEQKQLGEKKVLSFSLSNGFL